MSNRTHLSNISGNKTEWPVYMTIANVSSKIRQIPSTHTITMVALLPIPINNRNIPQKRLDEQRQTNREMLNKVHGQVLQPLTFEQNPNAESGYYNVLCIDRYFRRCKVVLAVWPADCPEYNDLHHVEQQVWVWCKCLKNELRDYVPSDKQLPRQDHNLDRTLSDAIAMTAHAKLSSCHVQRGFNVFRHIPCIVGYLVHKMQIGMHDHLQKWMFHFMKTHERLNKYNAIWLSMPAYHNLKTKNKSWGSFSLKRKGDKGNELLPAWSCNQVSTRRKPRLVSHIQSRNWVLMGVVRILYVCSM